MSDASRPPINQPPGRGPDAGLRFNRPYRVSGVTAMRSEEETSPQPAQPAPGPTVTRHEAASGTGGQNPSSGPFPDRTDAQPSTVGEGAPATAGASSAPLGSAQPPASAAASGRPGTAPTLRPVPAAASANGKQNGPAAAPQGLPPSQVTPIAARIAALHSPGSSAGGSALVGFLCLALLIGGFVLWAWQGRIAGAVVAPGQVEVEQHRQVVQHLDGGVVEEILVREGQRVEAGQQLIRLDGAQLKTELTIVQGQYYEVLSRQGRLEAERSAEAEPQFPTILIEAARTDAAAADLMKGQTDLFQARRATLDQSLDQLDKQASQIHAQIDGIDAQKAALSEQRELIGKELTDAQALLKKGLAQAPRVLALQRDAAGLDGQVGALASDRAQADTKITEIGVEQLRMKAEMRENAETELRDIGYRVLELAERRRALTEQIARLEIRAPVSGIVHQLQITTPRSVIRPAEPVMFLIPQDRPLVIAAHVAPINIDEVRVGQPVVLRFSSFSSRTTPEIDGILAQISPDAVVDEASHMSYYRAEVTIPPEQMQKLGGLSLLPGMPVEVYIQTGERSPLSYMIKPLSDYFNRAFRES